MTCEHLLQRASDVLDGEVSPATRVEVDAHLATCAQCRKAIADLRVIRQTAATLDRTVPPARLWRTVAARLGADPEFRAAADRQRGSAPHVRGWAWVAAAAVLVLLAGSGIWYMVRTMRQDGASASSTGGGTAAGNATSDSLVESIEAELQLAASHYEKAIAGLEQVANQSDSPLDAELTGTLRKNLDLIDRAIEESRAALRAEPGSRVAQESLFEAFRRKIDLLQDTIALMNEMRKGNQAEAARIVEGLNKS